LEWNFGDSEILALLTFLLGASHAAGMIDHGAVKG
jgi:hypothetical protein